MYIRPTTRLTMTKYSEDYRLTMTPAQEARLESEAERRGVSKAQILREALEQTTHADAGDSAKSALADVREEIEEKEKCKEELLSDVEQIEDELAELRDREDQLVAKVDEASRRVTYSDHLKEAVDKYLTDKPAVIITKFIDSIAERAAKPRLRVKTDLINLINAAESNVDSYTVTKKYLDHEGDPHEDEHTVDVDFDGSEVIDVYPGKKAGRPIIEVSDELLDNWDKYWPPEE